jgi:hypothetical protein
LKAAAVGAALGAAASCPGSSRSAARAFTFAALGVAIGFAAGMLWDCRLLTASVASGALNSVGKVRDEHWLERHPIDYA